MTKLLGVIFLIALFQGLRADAALPRLSPDWFAPEATKDFTVTRESSEAIDTMFSATADVVDMAKAGRGATVPWYLAYLKTDLGISASGLFGMVVLQGSAAVSLRWQPKRPPAPAPPPFTGPSVVKIESGASADDIMEQLAPFIETVIRGGEVRDPVLFRDSLRAQAEKFAEHVRSMTDIQAEEWWVAGFRLELDVDVSGMVAPAISIGGSLGIRFEWDRLTCAKSPRWDLEDRGDKLRELVLAIAEDLRAVSQETFSDTAFFPHGINIGLGINAAGNIGVVKASVAAIGTVLFSNGAEAPPAPSQRSALMAIPVLESGPAGIFTIDRVRFRRGLQRAAKLGHSLAERASRLRPKRWSLYELAVNYSLGVGGTLGLVTVTGQVNAEIDFFHRSTP